MKWLFVTSQFPWPTTHGQWLRVYHLARTLRSQGDEVAVLTCMESPLASPWEGVTAYQQHGVEVIPGPQRKHLNKGRARTFLGPYAFDPQMAASIAAHSDWADAVVLSHSRMLQYSREASRSGCVVADVGDDPVLEYSRRRRDRPSIHQWWWCHKTRLGRIRYERECLTNVQAATFVSDADATSLSLRHPQVTTACVANGVDTDHFRRPLNFQIKSPSPTLVFTGHMGNPNNGWAAEYLVREIAPLVWEKQPGVRVQIVGAEPTPAVKALASERVDVTGTVADIRPYLWNASLVTLAMRSGTGIKNKLLEAWAAGTAVVATPLACQGVDASDGKNLAVASSTKAFAARILSLLIDEGERSRLAAVGQRTVEQKFTWDAAAIKMRNIALQRRQAARTESV